MFWGFLKREILPSPEMPYSVALVAVVAVTRSIPLSACQHRAEVPFLFKERKMSSPLTCPHVDIRQSRECAYMLECSRSKQREPAASILIPSKGTSHTTGKLPQLLNSVKIQEQVIL